jgi:hypothetical protein
VVELGVVQAVQQVDRARAGGRGAHSDPSGELGVADRLERRHLLVPRLNELRLVLGPAPGRQEAVDPVTRIAEDVLDTPLLQALQDVVGYLHRHSDLLFAGTAAPCGRLASRCRAGETFCLV